VNARFGSILGTGDHHAAGDTYHNAQISRGRPRSAGNSFGEGSIKSLFYIPSSLIANVRSDTGSEIRNCGPLRPGATTTANPPLSLFRLCMYSVALSTVRSTAYILVQFRRIPGQPMTLEMRTKTWPGVNQWKYRALKPSMRPLSSSASSFCVSSPYWLS